MKNQTMYQKQLTQVLNTELFNDELEYLPLYSIFNELVDAIKFNSIMKNNAVIPVQLTNVDKEHIEKQARLCLIHNTTIDFKPFSEDEIVNTLINNVDVINKKISHEIQLFINIYKMMGKEPVFLSQLISLEEFRKYKVNKIMAKLRVHPDYPFYHGDGVTFTTVDKEGKRIEKYALLHYEPDMGAFMLIYFTDENATAVAKKENGETDCDFLYEIGLDALEKIEQ